MGASQDRARFRFGLLDADDSGVLERGDFELLADRVIAASGIEPGTAEALRVRAAYLTYWQGLYEQADSNGDGVVDFEEYSAVVHDRAAFERYVRPYAEALVGAADRDGDGWVERERYVACMVATGFPAAGAEATFAELDPAGTGVVSGEQWLESIAGYYTGEGYQVTDRLLG
ncbi:EF-hand domain-containing protein [Kitasatospora sp. NPDC051853]|uniref:EF-hand domain-containing protein n=1 Tax=Kitasatospora sp. NPDC051853 TaxID=3364058 RepID=UPI0037AAFE74